MKVQNILILVFLLSCTQISFAQIKVGIRGGISTTNVDPGQLIILNKDDIKEFGLSVKEANYGAHFGLFAQAKIGKFFIQPEVVFNTNAVDYELNNFTSGETVGQLFRESYQHLDIPIMMGMKFGPLRLQGGPVGHLFINSSSELTEVDGYEQNFEKLTYGWQAGVGLDIWKFIIDVKYEGNFQKFGDHFTFFGNQYNFDQRPGRIVTSLGITF